MDVTAATLIETSPLQDGMPVMPECEDGDWHPRAIKLWSEIWRSPMASEYTEGDVHRIEAYVQIFDRMKKKFAVSLAAELRLQGVCLGLTPIDRRRLQWEIKRAEPEGKKAPERKERPNNPLAALKAV